MRFNASTTPVLLALCLAWPDGIASAGPDGSGRAELDGASAGKDSPLDTALAVRSVSAAEAEEGRSVDLSATVIYADSPRTVFLQDGTAGIFFQLDGRRSPKPGDQVRVRGVTYPGLYVTGIADADFEVTGRAGLPDPRAVGFDELASGRYHYQLVSVEGIVRSVSPVSESDGLVRVALGARVFEIRVDEPPPLEAAEELVDSRVRVTGLAAGRINLRRQLVAPYLRCRDWSGFEILEKAPPLDGIPNASPEQLLTFDVEGSARNRVRLRGTVLANFPGGDLFLRGEEGAAIGVSLAAGEVAKAPEDDGIRKSDIRVGDLVEVIGFPELKSYSATLGDGRIVEREEAEALPEAVPVSLADLAQGERDGDLVAVRGQLADLFQDGRGRVLVLRDGDRSLRVRAPADLEPAFSSLAPGAELAVTGICQVETSRSAAQYRAAPESLSLRARLPSDIRLLRPPQWWTPRRLLFALAGLALVVVLAALWIGLLQRQVRRQTAALRRRIESEAALEERQRLAREFHDTLEQDLAGLSLRLDAAAAREVRTGAGDGVGGGDEKMHAFLEGARSLISRIQGETRNLVADLREERSASTDLVEALAEAVASFPEEVGPEIRFGIADGSADGQEEGSGGASDLPAVSSRSAHHLKMIVREAITNAVKHAEAERILVAARVADGRLVLTVTDDGRGFDAGTETRGRSGHFGCMGIRERARKIGAEVDWTSSPGGTTVAVGFPLQHS